VRRPRTRATGGSGPQGHRLHLSTHRRVLTLALRIIQAGQCWSPVTFLCVPVRCGAAAHDKVLVQVRVWMTSLWNWSGSSRLR
jgi:hypothetical protein